MTAYQGPGPKRDNNESCPRPMPARLGCCRDRHASQSCKGNTVSHRPARMMKGPTPGNRGDRLCWSEKTSARGRVARTTHGKMWLAVVGGLASDCAYLADVASSDIGGGAERPPVKLSAVGGNSALHLAARRTRPVESHSASGTVKTHNTSPHANRTAETWLPLRWSAARQDEEDS